jgi:hypothetical protein
MAIASEVTPAQIVCEEDDDIGLGLRHRQAGSAKEKTPREDQIPTQGGHNYCSMKGTGMAIR